MVGPSLHPSMTPLIFIVIFTLIHVAHGSVPTEPNALNSRVSRFCSSSGLQEDLTRLLKWVGDSKRLTPEEQTETVAAVRESSARFFPDLDQESACRAILSSMKAENDFNPSTRDASKKAGTGIYQELDLFKRHYQIGNSYSGLSSLKDYIDGTETAQKLDVSSLTVEDLDRPWINIHIATWIQSNLGRTSSRDPSRWVGYTQLGGGNGNAGRRRRKQMLEERNGEVSGRIEQRNQAVYPNSLRTSFGSWIAGPGKTNNDKKGYKRGGDKISSRYLNEVMEGVKFLYRNDSLDKSWLSELKLKPGTIDYKSS